MVKRGVELIELRGAAELSLREVARLVGVSQTAPTHHFGDKEGLLAAIASEGFRVLMGERLAALKDGMTKEQRLRVVMRVYVSFALRHPELFHLMFGTRIPDKRKHAELMEASAASFQFLSNSIAEFMAADNSERPPRFSRAGRMVGHAWAGDAAVRPRQRLVPGAGSHGRPGLRKRDQCSARRPQSRPGAHQHRSARREARPPPQGRQIRLTPPVRGRRPLAPSRSTPRRVTAPSVPRHAAMQRRLLRSATQRHFGLLRRRA
ncbi:WHG domain-containing protein [Pseudoduganella sp. UC29_106]|uniref:TetR/AcrR family transcriptional regulator n=1 Tax=Pseudoduganella sp. UC29_106 TaxID=3374553 RepID=UPI0037579615